MWEEGERQARICPALKPRREVLAWELWQSCCNLETKDWPSLLRSSMGLLQAQVSLAAKCQFPRPGTPTWTRITLRRAAVNFPANTHSSWLWAHQLPQRIWEKTKGIDHILTALLNPLYLAGFLEIQYTFLEMLKRTVGGIHHVPAAAVGPKPDDTHHARPPHAVSFLM